MTKRTEKLALMSREARSMAVKLLPRPDKKTAILPLFMVGFSDFWLSFAGSDKYRRAEMKRHAEGGTRTPASVKLTST